MHILLISPTSSPVMSGSDRDWATLANALPTGEFRITWVRPMHSAALRPHLDEQIVTRLADVPVPPFTYLNHENATISRSRFLWLKILVDHALRLREPLKTLKQLLRDDKPDLVVSTSSTLTLGAAYAALARRPHIWCVKECMDAQNAACRHYANVIKSRSNAVIVPSRAVAEPFSGGVHILPDGNDSERIRSGVKQSRENILTELNLPLHQPVVAQVGAFYPLKGQHVSAQAMEQIAAENQTPTCSLLFLGAFAHDGYENQLQQILSQMPAAWRDSVRFQSFEADDYSYLAAADVILHPSTLPDSFPNAVREAMILGKPVVASRCGGIPDMIDSGATGVLVTPGNADELAQALTPLLNSAQKREQMGHAAVEFASRQFDIHRTKEAFCKLLRQCAAK